MNKNILYILMVAGVFKQNIQYIMVVARVFKQNILYILVVAMVFKQEHTIHIGGFSNRTYFT